MIDFDILFANNWHFAGTISELSNTGDFIKYSYLGKDVVIYNDGSEIIAFDNVCPHRGAKFFSAEFGNSLAVCKYHGWSISHGKVQKPREFDNFSCKIPFRRYSVDYCGSLVFFSITPSQSLCDALGTNIYELIEAISFDFYQLGDINHYDFECNVVVAVENALEPDHVPFIHADTLLKFDLNNQRNDFFGKHSFVRFDLGNLRQKWLGKTEQVR